MPSSGATGTLHCEFREDRPSGNLEELVRCFCSLHTSACCQALRRVGRHTAGCGSRHLWRRATPVVSAGGSKSQRWDASRRSFAAAALPAAQRTCSLPTQVGSVAPPRIASGCRRPCHIPSRCSVGPSAATRPCGDARGRLEPLDHK